MTTHDVKNVLCHRCYALLDVGDKYCRHCGAPLGAPAPETPARPERHPRNTPSRPAPPGTRGRPKPTDNPWVILVLLFAVLGPGAIPMLWRSSAFSLTWKIILTALVLGITALAVWLLWYVVQMTLEPLKELRSLEGFH